MGSGSHFEAAYRSDRVARHCGFYSGRSRPIAQLTAPVSFEPDLSWEEDVVGSENKNALCTIYLRPCSRSNRLWQCPLPLGNLFSQLYLPSLTWFGKNSSTDPLNLSERNAQGRRSPKATNVVPRPRSILSFLGRAVRRTRTWS